MSDPRKPAGALQVPNLDEGLADDATFGARVFAALAAVGTGNALAAVVTVLAEVTALIPRQRLERVADFARRLGEACNYHAAELDRLRAIVEADEERLELLERGFVDASRASGGERRQWIAELVARGMTTEERSGDEAKKLLFLLESLTNSEVITLIALARPNGAEAARHYELHKGILRPASEEVDAPPAERDKFALQSGYFKNLDGLGLTEDSEDGPTVVTELGLLLLRYIGVDL